MKRIIKQVICFILKLIIPIVRIFPVNKSKHNAYDEYEKNINSKYVPKRYEYEERVNLPIDEKTDLSIIITFYNSEKYIKKCIDSIISNITKYNYEIICVNDGSTDNSLSILQEYKEIKIISQENQGIAAARNVALKAAVGKYVAYIDSDDYVAPNFIEKLLDTAYEDNCDLVKCGFYRDYGTKLEKNMGLTYSSNNGFNNKITEIPGFIWGSIIKREILFKFRSPDGYWCEDMVVRPIIYTRCKTIRCISDCLYYYRQHELNTSKFVEHMSDYKSLCQYYLPRDILEYAKDIGIEIDDRFKLLILKEFELISYTRLINLPKDLKKHVFYLNCKLLKELNIEKLKDINKWDKLYIDAFMKENYLLYTMVAVIHKWSQGTFVDINCNKMV